MLSGSYQKLRTISLAMLAGIAILPASVSSETPLAITLLSDPDITLEMMKNSGFSISYDFLRDLDFDNDQVLIGAIFLPLGDEEYRVVTRYHMGSKSKRNPIHRNSTELVAYEKPCATYQDSRGQHLDAKICSYKIALTDAQIHALANSQMPAEGDFFAKLGRGEGNIPRIAESSLHVSIPVETYNLDHELNRALWENTAKTWLACWETQDFSASGSSRGLDHPKTDGLTELEKCRDVRYAAGNAQGTVNVGIVQAEAEAAAAEAEAAIADARREKELNDVLKRWIDQSR